MRAHNLQGVGQAFWPAAGLSGLRTRRTPFILLALVLATSAFAQETPNGVVNPRGVASVETNPFDTPKDAEIGRMTFVTSGGCAYCHSNDGTGGRGANLTLGEYRFGGSDAQLFETIRNGIPGTDMPPTRGPEEDIWRLVAFVKRLGSQGLNEKAPGDAAAGKVVYDTKGGCKTCHMVGQEGGIIGPDLTRVGRRRSLKFLEESLVAPEADLPLNYRGVRVTTASGETVTGIRLNEDDISIQLRDMNGNLRSFLKDKVKEIQRDKPSLMPAYGSVLIKKELEDLVAYLSSLRGTL
jgi:putative heme-binding domain-containing protein